MEKLVAELKQALPLKSTTERGDIVIIAAKEPRMLTYAVVTNIERDETRKEEWWHVTMQILGIPIQKITWTLRTPQFTGAETFTMGGEARFIQAVELESEISPAPTKKSKTTKKKPSNILRVVK